MVMKIIKWVSLPVLLVGSMFSRFAGIYELPIDIAICLGAILAAQRAFCAKEFLLTAGFVAVAVVFSPAVLVIKLMLMVGLIGIATLVNLFFAWKMQKGPPV